MKKSSFAATVALALVLAGCSGKDVYKRQLASVGWYGFHTQYWFSGDSTFVAEVYPKAVSYTHLIWFTVSL